MTLVESVYAVTDSFPRKEDFVLTQQMRRSAVSVPSNIAEGTGRGSHKEFAQFLRISKGSVRELETQIEIARRIGLLSEEAAAKLSTQTSCVCILLAKLIKSISPPA